MNFEKYTKLSNPPKSLREVMDELILNPMAFKNHTRGLKIEK
jgi:hypothetical protein